MLRWAFAAWRHPLVPLAAAKILSLATAGWAWHTGRHGALRKVNLFFVACVAWNLLALGLGSGPAH